MDLDEFKKKAAGDYQLHKRAIRKLKKVNAKELDATVKELHDNTFEDIDCLDCANCCKTTSPIFYPRDIDRLARFLSVKPGELITRYLHVDDEGDYVLNSAPCPFLSADNRCTVYDHRPKACREYPHTDRKRFYQILDLTLKNTKICPAVHEIVSKLSGKYE